MREGGRRGGRGIIMNAPRVNYVNRRAKIVSFTGKKRQYFFDEKVREKKKEIIEYNPHISEQRWHQRLLSSIEYRPASSERGPPSLSDSLDRSSLSGQTLQTGRQKQQNHINACLPHA